MRDYLEQEENTLLKACEEERGVLEKEIHATLVDFDILADQQQGVRLSDVSLSKVKKLVDEYARYDQYARTLDARDSAPSDTRLERQRGVLARSEEVAAEASKVINVCLQFDREIVDTLKGYIHDMYDLDQQRIELNAKIKKRAVEQDICLIGGHTPQFAVYQPSSDTWRQKAPPVQGRKYPGNAVMVGQEIGKLRQGLCSAYSFIYSGNIYLLGGDAEDAATSMANTTLSVFNLDTLKHTDVQAVKIRGGDTGTKITAVCHDGESSLYFITSNSQLVKMSLVNYETTIVAPTPFAPLFSETHLLYSQPVSGNPRIYTFEKTFAYYFSLTSKSWHHLSKPPSMVIRGGVIVTNS
eukprot:gene17464-20838_t